MISSGINEVLTYCLYLTILIWYLHYLWRRRKLYIHSWKVPGPFSFPFIGTGYKFLGNNTEITASILKIHSNYTGLFRVWLGPRLIYFVVEPEHIEKILTSPNATNKDDIYKFITYFTGTGLLTATKDKWKRHRKIINPSFNQKVLDSFVEVFSENAVILSEQLEMHLGQKNIDLLLLLSRCTLDLICETAMGVHIKSQTTNNPIGRILDEIMEITALRAFQVWNHITFIWRLNSMSRVLDKNIKEFQKLTGSVINQKLKDFEIRKTALKSSLDAKIEEEPVKRLAFLDLLLETSNFTEKELREEVAIFIITGTDTTASSLMCTFILLGMYQDIQQRVYEEVTDIIGGDRNVVTSDLPHMNYLERVIKESLRLFPVGSFFLRSIDDDIDLGKVTIPKGSGAFFNPVHIHRNPKYWSDPLKFDPNRFLPEEIAKRHPCTYIPFSYGHRNCIGIRYGMMSMKTILATVLRKYKVFSEYKSIEEITLTTNGLLRLKDGAKISFELR